nr:hypothetical protein BaRGS_006724 [Batillaria attramentaria]
MAQSPLSVLLVCTAIDRGSDKIPGEAITSNKKTDDTVSKAEATTEPRGIQHAATTCAESVMLGAAPLNQSEWAEAPPTPTPRPQPAHDLDEGAQSSVGREPLLREQEQETEEDLRPNETRRYEADSCHHGRGECRDKRLMNVPPSNTDNDHSVAFHTGQVYPGTEGIPYDQAN